MWASDTDRMLVLDDELLYGAAFIYKDSDGLLHHHQIQDIQLAPLAPLGHPIHQETHPM